MRSSTSIRTPRVYGWSAAGAEGPGMFGYHGAARVLGPSDRREESLRTMANRMMERAVSTGRTVHMEPMPARERRIVHMALSSSRKVSTESVGEGEARKVTIIPKPGGGGRPGGPGRSTRRLV